MIGTRHPASFRDPSGFVFRREGLIHRQIEQRYAPHYELLLSSGLYHELTSDGLLLPHDEVDLRLAVGGSAYRVIRPVQLPFVSYPYEWCFSQLKDAALATLTIQRRALARGMTLKDASAFNIQFHGPRPVLIDTLSFEQYEAGRPWAAYRQFCQHFLAPLALMSKTDIRLGKLLRIYLDGIPLDLCSRMLPWSTRWNLTLGLHIHAHARSQKKHEGNSQARQLDRPFSRRSFEALLGHLHSAIERLSWAAGQSEWSDYYQSNNNYGQQSLESKEQIVSKFLDIAAPRIVWDLGANVGRFGRLASQRGAKLVVAWDIDPACVEANYRQVVQQQEQSLLPLVLDLTNPSPSIGWAHRERTSLAERGPADVVLALGLLHHLAISNNVPLEQIAVLLAQLGRWLIVEWVPKHDSQVQKLLASRADVFEDYQQEAFEQAFSRSFVIHSSSAVVGSQRAVYLMKARQ